MGAATKSACTICHKRKVRCDADDVGTPCTNCRGASRDADCRIHVKKKRVSARRRQQHDFMTDREEDGIRQAAGSEAQSSDKLATTPSSYPQQEEAELAYSIRVAAADGGDTIYKRHLVEFVEHPQLAERPIDRNARIMYIGNAVSNVHFLASQHFGDRTNRIFHYPVDRLARRDTCHEPDRLPLDALQLPARTEVDKLLDAYFRHVNPGFPVVDEDLFMEQYRSRDADNPPSLLLLQAILVVGAHAMYDDAERQSMKSIFFRRAKALFDARFERNRDTVVQAALLLSWHADGQEDVTANAWFWIGVAVRSAMGLGMHRDADKSTIVPHNKRMWRRVWWLLFQCDVLLSLQYGRAPSIRLEECDLKMLQVSDFQDCGSSLNPQFMMQFTELCLIISHALRERFNLTSTARNRREVLDKADRALAQWSLQLPCGRLMPASKPTPASPSPDIWLASLQLHYNMALILLHRSLPAAGPPLPQDAEICGRAAGFVLDTFQSIRDSGHLRCLWISVVNCTFTALLQLNLEVRTANPVMAVPTMMRYDALVSSLQHLVRYWPNALPILHFFESIRTSSGESEKVLQSRRQGDPDLVMLASDVASHDVSSTNAAAGTMQSPPMSMASIQPEMLSDPVRTGSDNGSPGSAMPHVSSLSYIAAPSTASETSFAYINNVSASDLSDAWQEWRNMQWRQGGDIAEDFLFTF